jgi:hypothetical protein
VENKLCCGSHHGNGHVTAMLLVMNATIGHRDVHITYCMPDRIFCEFADMAKIKL